MITTVLDLEEVKNLSKAIYTNLKIEDFFTQTNFHERYGNQLLRIGSQFNIISRKTIIINNYVNEYIKWHNDKTLTPQMTKQECLIEFITLFCSFGLTHYELLKRFFLEVLDIDKVRGAYTSENISKTSKNNMKITYGGLVNLLSKCPNFTDNMLEMLDVDFRNALAHDAWYFEDNQMTYKTSKEQVRIPIKDIPQKISIILRVYHTITTSYFEDYEPDVVKHYEQIGSEKFNKIFPLYGMDNWGTNY